MMIRSPYQLDDPNSWSLARWRYAFGLIVGLFLSCTVAHLQPMNCSAQEAAAEAEGMVKLNFPEQMDLKLLIEYVSSRLNVKILYDEAIANKKLTIKAPNEIPTTSLLNLLESALKMKGLALVDADVPGWKQIVESRDLVKIAEPAKPGELPEPSGTLAVTQAFPLKHIKPQQLSQLIKPFLTEPGANTITIEEQNLLIITDYAKNLQRISELIETIDQACPLLNRQSPGPPKFNRLQRLPPRLVSSRLTNWPTCVSIRGS